MYPNMHLPMLPEVTYTPSRDGHWSGQYTSYWNAYLCLKWFFSVRRVPLVTRTMSSSTPAVYNFETLNVTRPKEFVVQVEVNRPDKRNAQNSTFYKFVLLCIWISLSNWGWEGAYSEPVQLWNHHILKQKLFCLIQKWNVPQVNIFAAIKRSMYLFIIFLSIPSLVINYISLF